MKSTTTARRLANPRRTTLMHLTKGAEGTPKAVPAPEYRTELPLVTANPRRTILMELPKSARPAEGDDAAA